MTAPVDLEELKRLLADRQNKKGSALEGNTKIALAAFVMEHCDALIAELEACICKGNWRNIIAECEHLIGQTFVDNTGIEYTFYGLVHGSDDYYYGMWRKDGEPRLLSCVGSIDGWGFRLVTAGAKP